MCVRIIKDKPECFDYITGSHVWIEGHKCDGKYAYAALAVQEGVATLHLRVHRWSISVLKEMKEDFHEIVAICQEQGAKTLLVINPDPDARWSKFIQHFVFNTPMGIAQMVIGE